MRRTGQRFYLLALVLLLAVLVMGPACTRQITGEPNSSAIQGDASSLFTDAAPTLTPFRPLQDSSQTQPQPANAPLPATPTPNPSHPAQTTQSTIPSTAAPAISNINPYLWIDPGLPTLLASKVTLPVGFALWPGSESKPPEGAALRLEAGGVNPLSHWVYALVAPFPTLEKGISSEELRQAWNGGGAPAFVNNQPLLLDEQSLHHLSAVWGVPAPGAVLSLPHQDLITYAWEHSPAWAIVPFEHLEPRWKVLDVDGVSPINVEFDPANYALSLPVSLAGDPVLVEQIMRDGGPNSPVPLAPLTNRDPERLTVVAMTGVTALVRATAFTMEQRGVLYPGKDVRDWLRQADITHISNEVPFDPACPYPNPVQPDMRFCSDPRYLELLEDVGADIIELTGDHFQDYGVQAMNYTLDLYRQHSLPYYGGGANLAEARKALIIEHHGNRIGFIGCNAKGGGYAQAAANHPGAVYCDLEWMAEEIARLRLEGVLPIATFQHFEYYTYQAQPSQLRDFRRLAEAGALIVSGSQAHQPQALEFNAGALIHYGLGNLFFDQYEVSPATRQGLIDRHVFYDGRYISSELLPIVFIDYARPRPMTPPEARELFEVIFSASGW